MKAFPFEMYHLVYGAVSVNNESDIENCLKNGFAFDPPSKTNAAFIKAKIAELKGDLAQLEINLIHVETEEAKLIVEEVEEELPVVEKVSEVIEVVEVNG